MDLAQGQPCIDFCVEYGDLATHFLGPGGIAGGGYLTVNGESTVEAAASKVLPFMLIAPQFPPFQKPEWEPSGLIWSAILFVTTTLPHDEAY